MIVYCSLYSLSTLSLALSLCVSRLCCCVVCVLLSDFIKYRKNKNFIKYRKNKKSVDARQTDRHVFCHLGRAPKVQYILCSTAGERARHGMHLWCSSAKKWEKEKRNSAHSTARHLVQSERQKRAAQREAAHNSSTQQSSTQQQNTAADRVAALNTGSTVQHSNIALKIMNHTFFMTFRFAFLLRKFRFNINDQ